jgi:hypothetical protein
MLQLKNELGHSEYAQFRFLIEAGLRARAKMPGRASGETTLYAGAREAGSVPTHNTLPTKCARGDVSGGRKCTKLADGGGKFCKGHTCKTTGCLNTRSSGDDACDMHAPTGAQSRALLVRGASPASNSAAANGGGRQLQRAGVVGTFFLFASVYAGGGRVVHVGCHVVEAVTHTSIDTVLGQLILNNSFIF